MDIILEFLDPLVLDRTYTWSSSYLATIQSSSSDVDISANPDQAAMSMWTRDSIYRQCVSIFFITQFGACVLYFFFSGLSYYFVFDRRLEHHPRFLKNQVRQEIYSALAAIPVINLLTLPWFLAEIRGYSLLYGDVSSYGWTWLAISALSYIAFNDLAIYWIHRLEHHPIIYKYIHKPHHKWIVPTPWAALAFHPLDGYVQSLPYHVFVFICPINKYLYMGLFIAVQIWTIYIHDSDMISGRCTERLLNTPAHHTLHHMHFNVNYGQYFTWCDKLFNSHRAARPELDPIHAALKSLSAKRLFDEVDSCNHERMKRKES